MRTIVLIVAVAVAPAALAQNGNPAAHAEHGVGACTAATCAADSTGDGHHDEMHHGGAGGHAMHPATHGAAESPAHEAVRATINRLFDAMRAGDGEALLAQFHEGATLTSVGAGRDGVLAARREGIEAFAEAVGTPHPEPYDERIGPIEVRVDGPLATAWMTYRFYVGERFSHCGVNAFQLADTGDGWKILAVTDTRRPECEGGE